MELAEEALHNVRKIIIKHVTIVGYENKVRCHSTYAC